MSAPLGKDCTLDDMKQLHKTNKYEVVAVTLITRPMSGYAFHQHVAAYLYAPLKQLSHAGIVFHVRSSDGTLSYFLVQFFPAGLSSRVYSVQEAISERSANPTKWTQFREWTSDTHRPSFQYVLDYLHAHSTTRYNKHSYNCQSLATELYDANPKLCAKDMFDPSSPVKRGSPMDILLRVIV